MKLFLLCSLHMQRAKKSYAPSQKILDRYADVLVNFALGGGKGVKKGEVVCLVSYESAKPLMAAARRAIFKAGGHVINSFRPDDEPGNSRLNLSKDFYLLAQDHHLDFFPGKYMRGLLDEMDHMLYIDSETDKQALKGIDPQKIMRTSMASKPFMDWRSEKERKGKFTWTIGLYGTEAMAREAGLSLEEYWDQIIKACYLHVRDPIGAWKEVSAKVEAYRKKLTALAIDKVHVEGPDADLWVTIGERRQWAGGGGRNIPSFEIFTSPDARGTNGWIRFNQPLYAHGNLITDISLVFKDGVVKEARAKKNAAVLREMIKTKGGNAIGEFSLTDKRFSNITKFMAETLFDENIGGPHGNMHLALGRAYEECYSGDTRRMKKGDWKKLGFNDSVIHSDIVSTAPRTVTAHFKHGVPRVIYEDGQFVL